MQFRFSKNEHGQLFSIFEVPTAMNFKQMRFQLNNLESPTMKSEISPAALRGWTKSEAGDIFAFE